MLTKEERAAIAARAKSLKGCTLYYKEIYKRLFDKYPQDNVTSEEEDKEILIRIIDLCDTANMVELPLDKDGEVINVGDVVFNKRNYRAYRVRGYEFNLDRCVVILGDDTNACSITYLESDVLIHKKPVTIASLAKELADIVAADYGTPMVVKRKISKIADKLEILSDSND